MSRLSFGLTDTSLQMVRNVPHLALIPLVNALRRRRLFLRGAREFLSDGEQTQPALVQYLCSKALFFAQ